MTARDVDLLAHRLDALTRAATRIRAHLADLHWLAHEKPTGETEHVKTTKTDWTPRGGDPRALHLWERLTTDLTRIEDTLVGYERAVLGYFMVTNTTAEPSRGSLIGRAEHDQLLVHQRARAAGGEYVPVRLVDQPPHPGKNRS